MYKNNVGHTVYKQGEILLNLAVSHNLTRRISNNRLK